MKDNLDQALGSDDSESTESYENHIDLPQSVLEQAQEGDEIEVTVKGTVVKNDDGDLCLQANEVNGEPLPQEDESAEQDDSQPDDSQSDDKSASILEKLKGISENGGY